MTLLPASSSEEEGDDDKWLSEWVNERVKQRFLPFFPSPFLSLFLQSPNTANGPLTFAFCPPLLYTQWYDDGWSLTGLPADWCSTQCWPVLLLLVVVEKESSKCLAKSNISYGQCTIAQWPHSSSTFGNHRVSEYFLLLFCLLLLHLLSLLAAICTCFGPTHTHTHSHTVQISLVHYFAFLSSFCLLSLMIERASHSPTDWLWTQLPAKACKTEAASFPCLVILLLFLSVIMRQKSGERKKALMRSYRRPVDDDGKLVLKGEKKGSIWVQYYQR